MSKKYFNINGVCYPEKHYMVNIKKRLEKIKVFVDKGEYFTINRARQYGKTTTLRELYKYLKQEYTVILLDFQRISSADFQNEFTFVSAFSDLFIKAIQNKKRNVTGLNPNIIENLKKIAYEQTAPTGLRNLFNQLSDLCDTSQKPIVLMIDEVDQAYDTQIFSDFLAQLRNFYLTQEETPVFHSVILVGIYDIKNLKQRIRPDSEHRYNSPWNIAARFDVDMSFSIEDISNMLMEYEAYNKTGMNLTETAEEIYHYTSGYPYLVSYICKILDEEFFQNEKQEKQYLAWTKNGIIEAVKLILKEPNTLFDDMIKKLEDYPELRTILKKILYEGKNYSYSSYHHATSIGSMFGFIKEQDGWITVTNRMFEIQLYNLFLSEEMTKSVSYQAGLQDKNQFIQDGYLNMDLVMKKFSEHFTEIYADSNETFLEENGRRFFLLYLKPIINGVGNYYIEARTRDMRRTDVIIDYRGIQYIVEMKLWHGEEYNHRGEQQLIGYLDDYHLKKGYLLSFNFNKHKTTGVHEIICDGKIIVEAVV